MSFYKISSAINRKIPSKIYCHTTNSVNKEMKPKYKILQIG